MLDRVVLLAINILEQDLDVVFLNIDDWFQVAEIVNMLSHCNIV